MKKLSEVCKTVGVTRRTLQEYDKIGLFSPTSKTDNGYWLYDDDAIKKLVLIQVFIEAGYERKKIKAILESEAFDLPDEYDHVINTLRMKKQRIDGMINTMETLKAAALLPQSTIKALSHVDLSRLYQDKSFSEYYNETVNKMKNYTETDYKEAATYMPFWYLLSAIGCLREEPMNSTEVQMCVSEFIDYFVQVILNDEEEENVEDTDDYSVEELRYEASKGILESIDEMFEDPEIMHMMELQCGVGALDYIKDAIGIFNENQKNKIKENEDGKL